MNLIKPTRRLIIEEILFGFRTPARNRPAKKKMKNKFDCFLRVVFFFLNPARFFNP